MMIITAKMETIKMLITKTEIEGAFYEEITCSVVVMSIKRIF